MDIGKLFRDAWGLFVKDIGPLVVGILIASLVPTVAAVVIAVVAFGGSISGLEVNDQGDVIGASSVSWALLIGGSVAIVVVVLFLSAPLYAGILTGVLRRVREGREMAYGDAFSGFAIFGRVIWACLVLGVVFTAIVLAPGAMIVGGAVAGSPIVAGLGAVVLLAAMVGYVYLAMCWVYVFPVIVDRGLGVTAAMGESRRLVHSTGWWWTFLVIFLLQLVVMGVSMALGVIPFAGAIATLVLYPFVLTYLVAMYFQARHEGPLIDAVLGWPRQVPAGPPAYSTPAAPYGAAPLPPAPPYSAASVPPAPPYGATPQPPGALPPSPASGAPAPPPADQGQAYVPAPPPLPPPDYGTGAPQAAEQRTPQTAVTEPAAPEAPAAPAIPEAPAAPEPPAPGPEV